MPKLYLIPCPIADTDRHELPPYLSEAVKQNTHFYVENLRSARRFISSLKTGLVIDELNIKEVNKDTDIGTIKKYALEIMQTGGGAIISEAGCPAVADPGSVLVAEAQKLGIEIVPMVGPNSILLALMGSGFNGQSFRFDGYLPIDEPACKNELRQIEQSVLKTGTTRLFMDTPYRNDRLLKMMFETLRPETLLCIACNLTAEDQYIRTMSIAEWKKSGIIIGKKPTIFAVGL